MGAVLQVMGKASLECCGGERGKTLEIIVIREKPHVVKLPIINESERVSEDQYLHKIYGQDFNDYI